LIEWLDRLIRYQGVDPNEITPNAKIIRDKLSAGAKMAGVLTAIAGHRNPDVRGTTILPTEVQEAWEAVDNWRLAGGRS
jgi:hypothetical protein